MQPQLQQQQLLQLQLQLQHYNYNRKNNLNDSYGCSYNYHDTTLQLQLRYRYTHWPTLHPAVVVDVTVATIPKSTAPTTFRSSSGFALLSMHHNNSPLLSCPILETSARALRGTTGNSM